MATIRIEYPVCSSEEPYFTAEAMTEQKRTDNWRKLHYTNITNSVL